MNSDSDDDEEAIIARSANQAARSKKTFTLEEIRSRRRQVF